ncbi:MAG: fumarylacetoacetate hydrolase family protein [Rhodospirillaceae bacterium]|nr:fumarylacetoacetate hydrolase family protein [Rhodospirillaceae bacterium]
MDAAAIEAAVSLLAAARAGGALIERWPDGLAPRDLADALAIQEAWAQRRGTAAVGWKIGATAPALQAKIGLAEPFYGRIFAGTIHAGGTRLPAGGGHNILEAEFAVRLGRGLPRVPGGYDRDDMADAIEAVLPAIEINRPSFRTPFAMRGWDVIADNGSNAGLVLGEAIADWRRHDLAASEVSFRLDGAECARGSGAAVMGHPFAALAWLANARAAQGAPLAAGEIVATGSTVGFAPAKAGQRAVADFGRFGEVSLHLT